MGRSRAISRSVASWKITYGGTPRARARSRRTPRSRSNSVRSTPSHDSDSARDRLRASPFFGTRCRASASPGTLASSLSSWTPCAVTRSTGYASSVWWRRPSPISCSMYPRSSATDASGSRPNVLSLSCARETTCSLVCPRRTLATCVAPNRWPTRTTHDRIFRARTTGLGCRLELAEAHVAGGAVVLRIAIAEIRAEVPVPAADARGVALHQAQQTARALGQLAVLLHHVAPLHEIRARVDQQALRFQAVASRPPGFLLVVLERSRRACMYDEPDVGSVDAHSERHGRHDDLDALVEERVLMRLALLVREPGVVRQRRGADLGEPRGERIDLPPRRAVDDARLAAVAFEHVEELPLQHRSRQDAVEEIRPIEGADQLDRIAQPELRADVAAHARRGRRGVGVHADAGQELAQPAELTILGPEVVPPLADAVRFVHGDEARAARRRAARENCRCRRRRAVPARHTGDGIGPHAIPRGRTSSRRTTSELLYKPAATPLPTSVST